MLGTETELELSGSVASRATKRGPVGILLGLMGGKNGECRQQDSSKKGGMTRATQGTFVPSGIFIHTELQTVTNSETQ